jgi:PPOX class probable F420-dependent enzyme
VDVPDLDRLPAWARDLLRDARVGHLGLLDDRDRPRVLPVTFALEGGALYSAVDDKPKRVAPAELARLRYLRRNPAASLTVDRYDDDWSRLAWVQALCRSELVEANGAPAAIEALREKYEPYRESAPPGPLIRLVPDQLLFWSAAS